jgi:hypothetical protein
MILCKHPPVTIEHPGRDRSDIRVSSFCTGGTCVGIEWHGDAVEVLDTKRVDGERLRFTALEWRAFLAGAKAGEFDRP